ncbi:hypothetical protein K5549_001622 [Capra hircus]|nr:hypothetical protein K5549_001622 [Capra hircus]
MVASKKAEAYLSPTEKARRAEKTEVLSEDLLQVEKRLELVKQVSHSTHKKLTACLQGQQGAEADKRSHVVFSEIAVLLHLLPCPFPVLVCELRGSRDLIFHHGCILNASNGACHVKTALKIDVSQPDGPFWTPTTSTQAKTHSLRFYPFNTDALEIRVPTRPSVSPPQQILSYEHHSVHRHRPCLVTITPSKKLPLTTLAQCLMEGSAILGDDTLLGKMLKLCGETEDKLAQELIHFELQVERDVIEPLFLLAEVEIPNIQKQRKHLAKLVLDMDSSRTRWQQTSKSSGLSSSSQPAGAKADALREEMEEAANRVEICRDQLSADMYSFVAKEIDYANYFQTRLRGRMPVIADGWRRGHSTPMVWQPMPSILRQRLMLLLVFPQLIEVQAEYHRKSLTLLQAVLPQIKAQQEAWVEKPSFGKPLEEHLTISGREIAFPIEACVTMLLECGMQEEVRLGAAELGREQVSSPGLFRVAPSASKLKKLKAALDCCVVDVQECSADPHAIAGALKSYLRELPEPLMTFELYDEWIQASNIQDQDKRLQALWNACEKLPKANHNNIRYLIKFLSKLSEYQDVNKMTPSNMAIVLGPNLLWPQAEGNITEMMTTVSLQIVGVIEPIIQHADWFFPGGMWQQLTWSQPLRGSGSLLDGLASSQTVCIYSVFPTEIEFNITGNYGSPVHVNHNANYSSMPSPDMDPADRRQPEQARRPLSVATDNMMLEFYKKDG